MEKIDELHNSRIITEILNKAFNTVALQFNFTRENAPRFPAFIDQTIIEKDLQRGLKMFGFKVNDRVAGCIGYSFYKEKIYLIERLATLPEYRHSGIGRKLMDFCENKIRDAGGKIIELHVVDQNKVLIEWYEKQGYRIIRVDEIKTAPFNSCVMNKSCTKPFN